MKTKLFLASAAVLSCIVSCIPEKHKPVKEGEFRSIIRLWTAHHLSDTLENKLVDAFRKYPQACDEVWFYFSDPADLPLQEKQERAEKMAKAAGDMRALGIIPSLQTVTIGHPTHETTDSVTNKFGWRAMTSIDGVHALTQTCPRDTAFLTNLAWEHAFYAEKFHPDGIYLDDDLRITSHYPVMDLCYCDSCIDEFNKENGFSFTRETLKEALISNAPGIRSKWITFSQESLAGVARIISNAVHAVSPDTHMGLQHVNFHGALMEGWDWNKIFNAMEEETGNVPYSRPGHGYYNDHSPRGMIEKAYGISRQIARLNPDITMIAPEIEGHRHKATGKSPQSVVTETLLYLGMGATSMSYALICSGLEPMEWYADTYFKALEKYHSLFRNYVAFNKNTKGGGIDAFIGQEHVLRNVRAGEDPMAWQNTTAGNEIFELAPLGIPFTPESGRTTATILDAEALRGMNEDDITPLLGQHGAVVDEAGWHALKRTWYTRHVSEVPVPEGLSNVKCYLSPEGRHIAVVPAFTADITNAERLNLLRIFDWASEGKMSVILESMAQAVIVPRISTVDGSLKSVVFVNATISDLPYATLRLRGCPEHCSISWESAGHHSRHLKAKRDGNDVIVTIPSVKAWDAGWIKID